jgi:hypothetical protein
VEGEEEEGKIKLYPPSSSLSQGGRCSRNCIYPSPLMTMLKTEVYVYVKTEVYMEAETWWRGEGSRFHVG